MADIATTSAEPQTSPKSTVKKERKQKSDRPKASHPSTAIMVNNAIQNLKERGGSSLQAIKKYISATYKVDAEKFAPFIKKYIKSSVASGALVQTKGKGASGSFKLASTAVTKKSVTATAAAAAKSRKSTTKSKPTKERKTTAKKSVGTKTAAAGATKSRKSANLEKKKSTSAKIAKPKAPSKVKKTTKAPTKKPKSPKPKTTKPKVVKKKAAASPKKK